MITGRLGASSANDYDEREFYVASRKAPGKCAVIGWRENRCSRKLKIMAISGFSQRLMLD